MKTTVKGLATVTFIAVLLMVGNVKATELKALNNGSIEIEETLQMENWMTCEIIWNTNFVTLAEFAVETEPGMELENWMTSTEVWNANKSYVEELETELEIEPWMTNDNIWNKINTENDVELTVEPSLID